MKKKSKLLCSYDVSMYDQSINQCLDFSHNDHKNAQHNYSITSTKTVEMYTIAIRLVVKSEFIELDRMLFYSYTHKKNSVPKDVQHSEMLDIFECLWYFFSSNKKSMYAYSR